MQTSEGKYVERFLPLPTSFSLPTSKACRCFLLLFILLFLFGCDPYSRLILFCQTLFFPEPLSLCFDSCSNEHYTIILLDWFYNFLTLRVPMNNTLFFCQCLAEKRGNLTKTTTLPKDRWNITLHMKIKYLGFCIITTHLIIQFVYISSVSQLGEISQRLKNMLMEWSSEDTQQTRS